MSAGLNLSVFTRTAQKCGVSDYSRTLHAELERLPEIESIRIVEAPADVVRAGTLSALEHYHADKQRFRELGAKMNEAGANIAHVQFQYFFFGGVAPHKNHTAAFLSAIRIPVVMTVHEIASPSPRTPFAHRLLLQSVNRSTFLHPAIRRLIVHTEQDRRRLERIGVKPQKIDVVLHGIPAPQPLPAPDVVRREMGLEGRRVLTLFGFLSNKKGHAFAINALAGLPEDVTLLFAGGQHPDDHTDYAPSLRRLVSQARLDSRVRFLDYLPEERIPAVMSVTDIALAPYSESSGSGSLALLMAYGLPIVASPIPSHEQIEAEEKGCLSLLSELSADALRDRVLSLLNSLHRLDELKRAALTYAETHSYRRMAEETLAIYRDVRDKEGRSL